MNETPRVIIVSGLSGAGKTVALHMLEDLGYHCIDNMPVELLEPFAARYLRREKPVHRHLALGLDARSTSEDIKAVPRLLRDLRAQGIRCDILFLRADRGVLFKRYSETRRRHPLARDGLGLAEAIDAELERLGPIADEADWVIDTSRQTIHQLRELIRVRIEHDDGSGLSILVRSFGFKHGVPDDADFVFDVRSLPNPFWEPALRSLTGRDTAIAEYLEQHEIVHRMRDDIAEFLDRWLPSFVSGSRNYINICFGCTGGQHRSVYFAERIGAHLNARFGNVVVRHDELD